MSQRLTEGTVGVQVSRKPKIIGWANGCPVWSLSGSEPDDGGTGDSTGGAGDGGSSGGEGGSGSEGQGKENEKEGEQGKENSGKDETVSRAEYEQLKSRMQAADRNKADVEKRLKEYEDKDKSELEKAQETAKTAAETVAAKDAVIRTQAVKLAFVTSASHITWHDPADALEFAMKELSDLEVKEDGTVDNKLVKAAADKLAKDKPYLVKGNTSQGGSGTGGSGASGQRVGAGSGSSEKDKLEREGLTTKYPALRR